MNRVIVARRSLPRENCSLSQPRGGMDPGRVQ